MNTLSHKQGIDHVVSLLWNGIASHKEVVTWL